MKGETKKESIKKKKTRMEKHEKMRREKRKIRKEAWDAHEERKLGQVGSGSGGGPGWRRRNQGKAEAPLEAVEWRENQRAK